LAGLRGTMGPVDELGLRALLDDVQSGAMSPDEAVARLRRLPFADVGGATVDHHRHLRSGMPEAVYGPGKSPAQCVAIVDELLSHGAGPVLLTRTDAAQRSACVDAHGPAVEASGSLVWRLPDVTSRARVAVVTAGTADLPVADECAATLVAYGVKPTRITDVGVAGVHRLLAEVDVLAAADVVVVVAGMEGALPSVVGGIAGGPVVAVPTSVGYGASLEGVTALLGMLSSCAAGITVVGIDNGFGAACAVARMFRWPDR
jgi:pyridinium-3,5-biscarboxylic acid mononucleotide synthase